MKKRWWFFILLIVILLVNKNPTKGDYENTFKPPIIRANSELAQSYKLERINFFLFSTYTPFGNGENGKTHLGILGHFFPISEGQFDYPKWLKLFQE